MLKLGRLILKDNFILAPLAGISDLPFRRLNRSFGCELAFIEMLNARSLSHKSIKTMQMLRSEEKDRPLGVQLLGCEEKFILRALEVIREYRFDILDFNAACPAKKVVRRGEGAALLKEPKKLKRLLGLLVRNSEQPVSVKIRSGWGEGFSSDAEEAAKYAEDAGISGLFIHGRTKEQGYAGGVDYSAIARVKKALKIPVIASGDILSPQLAEKMFKETVCDGIVIARGALGNPWIFRQIKEFLEDRRLIAPVSKEEIIRVMREHLELNCDFYKERIGVMLFRKFFSWYTKGFRGIRPLRERSSLAKTRRQMLEIINLAAAGKNKKSRLRGTFCR